MYSLSLQEDARTSSTKEVHGKEAAQIRHLPETEIKNVPGPKTQHIRKVTKF